MMAHTTSATTIPKKIQAPIVFPSPWHARRPIYPSRRYDAIAVRAALRQRHGLEDFLEGGEALRDLGRAGDAQRAHARLVRRLGERDDVRLLADESPQVARELHDLVEAHAAHVAGVAALEAADRAIDVLGRGRLERRANGLPEGEL